VSGLFQSLSVAVLFLCAAGILLVNNWRWMTGILALQYVGVLGLVSISWPVEIAVVKLVAGWMASAVLFLTYVNVPASADDTPYELDLPVIYFRGFAAVLIGLSVYSLVPAALRWFLGATSQQTLGGLLLLLTFISGFEILYATLEASVLMTGLLAILNIGIAFIGAYLLLASHLEEQS